MDSATKNLLETSGLTKSFSNPDGANIRVLEGLSLSVPSGSIVSILGASGCGKSTLLKILAGVEESERGVVSTDFARPSSHVGFMQQGERLLPWRTVLGNVSLGMELCGISRKAALDRAREQLGLVGLWEFRDAYPTGLSGGMIQRVLLARTLAQQPRLLLLDEPLGQLDIVGRRELAAIIREYVAQHRAAAIVVTHSVEEAIFIADCVCTMSRRPARIVEKFSFENPSAWPDAVSLDRAHSFDRVYASLVDALKFSDGVR